MNFIAPLLLLLLSSGPVQAQASEPNLRVATRLVKPFIFEERGKLTGFSVELWQEIAKQMNVKSEYVVKPNVKELLASVNSHEAALGIAAISITAERELQWDFSQPMFDAGLQILVSAQATESSLIGNIVAGIFTRDFLTMIGIVILCWRFPPISCSSSNGGQTADCSPIVSISLNLRGRLVGRGDAGDPGGPDASSAARASRYRLDVHQRGSHRLFHC
jgi:ABC-type amino acid transport substrate-binding protein